MNKIEIYDKVVDRFDNSAQNFLDGLLFLDEFSFFYNLIKTLDDEIEIIPTFKYNEAREKSEELMRIFKVKVVTTTKSLDDIISFLNSYVEDGRFRYNCSYDDTMESVIVIELI